MKENPHHVKQAAVLTPETVGHILKHVQPESPGEFQDKAFFALTVFAGMRTEDVDGVFCRNVEKLPYDSVKKVPRQ